MGAALWAATVLSAPAALAQPTAAETLRARELHAQGGRLMDKGQFEKACPLLEESDRVAADNGTEMELAECYEKLGKTWASFSLYRRIRAKIQASPGPLQEKQLQAVQKRMDALSLKLPRVKIALSDRLTVLDGLKITLDGEALSAAEWGALRAVEPGRHVILVSAPGKKTASWEKELTAGEQTATFEALEDTASAAPDHSSAATAPTAPTATATAPLPSVSVGPSAQPSSLPGEPSSGVSGRQVGIGVGLGVAAAGLAISIGLGVAAGDKAQSPDGQKCSVSHPPGTCNSFISEYSGLEAGAGIAGGAAGVGLILASVLYFTRPAPAKATIAWSPVVGPDGAGLSVRGRF